MIQTLINRYKQFRKNDRLNNLNSYKCQYAFIGVGGHSLDNLYPVIDYLGIPLKYIHSRTLSNAEKLATKYNAKATSNLDDILNDDEIKGVFVCASPTVHFDLGKQVLEKGKNLFIEKPPCTTASELNQLITLAENKHVVTGFQKRYSTVYTEIKKAATDIINYDFKYLTGALPEGDAILDLFIHPIDLLSYLFSGIAKMDVLKRENTFLIQLEHTNGIAGQVQLSTDYAWSNPIESLVVNTKSEIYEVESSLNLTRVKKPKMVAGIPLEKIWSKPVSKEILFESNGFIPLAQYNHLFVQGYYSEIKTFVDLCEGKKTTNLSSLGSLQNTFEIVDRLKNCK